MHEWLNKWMANRKNKTLSDSWWLEWGTMGQTDNFEFFFIDNCTWFTAREFCTIHISISCR